MPSSIIKDTLRPHLEKIRSELTALAKMRIRVGVQGDEDSDILVIAGVHEYGATITAKNAKNLAIPLKKEAQGKSPRDFPGLFFIEMPDTGNVFGVTLKGNRRDKGNMDNLNFLFLLLRSVTVPERSFIRASYDAGGATIEQAAKEAIEHIILDAWTAKEAAEHIGARALAMTQEYFNTKLSPPKGALTQSLSTQSQPLYESGRLYRSITYTVEEGE